MDFDVRDNRCTFPPEEELLWILIWAKNVLMLDFYQFLSSPDVNWWTGVLWCFNQTLILTAPIHCRVSIAETLMQRHISTDPVKKQTHPNLGWPEDTFSKNFNFNFFKSQPTSWNHCITHGPFIYFTRNKQTKSLKMKYVTPAPLQPPNRNAISSFV